jgi:hypothetical protein
LSEYFDNVPSDAIGSPNAEHHNMLVDGGIVSALHVNGLGSNFSSDPVNNGGKNGEWRETLKKILDALQFPDGGGITINHPKWSDEFNQVNMKLMIPKMLDYDSRVLGIEIYNHTSDIDQEHLGTGYALDYWDDILKTGRRCWGFAVPDWHTDGRNILLVDEATEEKCLKAYRKGNFYSRIKNTDLSFTNISFANNVLTVSTNKATSIDVVVNGVHTKHYGSSCSQTISNFATYFRVSASNDSDEIYSNPFILKEHTDKKNKNVMMWY